MNSRFSLLGLVTSQMDCYIANSRAAEHASLWAAARSLLAMSTRYDLNVLGQVDGRFATEMAADVDYLTLNSGVRDIQCRTREIDLDDGYSVYVEWKRGCLDEGGSPLHLMHLVPQPRSPEGAIEYHEELEASIARLRETLFKVSHEDLKNQPRKIPNNWNQLPWEHRLDALLSEIVPAVNHHPLANAALRRIIAQLSVRDMELLGPLTERQRVRAASLCETLGQSRGFPEWHFVRTQRFSGHRFVIRGDGWEDCFSLRGICNSNCVWAASDSLAARS